MPVLSATTDAAGCWMAARCVLRANAQGKRLTTMKWADWFDVPDGDLQHSFRRLKAKHHYERRRIVLLKPPPPPPPPPPENDTAQAGTAITLDEV